MSIEDDEDDTRIWDTREARRALRTLCEEVRKAAEEGLQPPCLAITPTPGTAIVHWNWAGPAEVTQRTKKLTAEQKARFLPRIVDGTEWWCQGSRLPLTSPDPRALTRLQPKRLTLRGLRKASAPPPPSSRARLFVPNCTAGLLSAARVSALGWRG